MTYVLLFLAGSVLGSFFNVLIYRVPRGLSIVRPASSCPACGTRIRPSDNVPILGYLFLRGRCRSCGEKISPRYIVVEALAGAIPALLHARYGLGPEFYVYVALSYALLIITFVDLDHRIIPDKITLPGLAVGLVAAPLLGLTTFSGSLIGAAIGGGALYLIAVLGTLVFRKESMGGGDIKLAAMLGAFLGWQAVVILLFLAFLVGAVAGVITVSSKDGRWDSAIPFGPFIALGSILTMLWGDTLVSWYLSMWM